MRYDPSTGIYRDCRWCNGRGCVSCKIEADKEYKRQFQDGPKLIATFSMEDIQAGKLKHILSPEAIQSASEEARKRAEEKLASLGGWRQLIQGTDEECIEAMESSLIGEVLAERITKAGQSVEPGES